MSSIIPLHIVNKLGYNPTTIYFNPRTVKFFNNLNDINKYDSRETNINENKEEIFHKAKKVSIVKFFLGNACNFRCSYCRQNVHEKLKRHDQEDIDNVVDSIRCVINENEPITVEFWGGEPLLYMDDMVRIVDKLPKNIRYHIVTNGSLVDKHFYNWISKLNHEVILSHDGPGQCNRTADPLESDKSRKYLIKLHKEKKNPMDFIINSVLTKDNMDIFKLANYLINIFDKNIIIAKMEPVIPYNEHAFNNAEKYNADMQILEEQLFKGMIDLYNIDFINNIHDISLSIKYFFNQHLDNNYCVNLHQPKCNVIGYKSLCFDWDGVVYPCQVYGGTNITLGKLTEGPNYPHAHMPKSMASMHCGNCPVVSLCKGVCPHIEDQYVLSSCKNKYTLYMAIFRLIMYQQNILITQIDKPIEI